MRGFQGTGGNPREPHAEAALADAVRLLSLVADSGEGHPPGHCARVAAVAVRLAEASGLTGEDLRATYYAGLLHEVGSLALGATHDGSNSSLERSKMVAMWDHPAQGARICAQIAALPPKTADLVRWHHESWDGSGYPDQLRWNAIPRQAQFLRVADAFVSMMAPRPHRESRSAGEAYAEILEATGRDFSPAAVSIFGTAFRTQVDGLAADAPVPGDPLPAHETDPSAILKMIGELVDNRLQNAGRNARIAEFATRTADKLSVGSADRAALMDAVALIEIGTVSLTLDEYLNFDVVSRLHREVRAKTAERAGDLVGRTATYAHLAPILRAQQEWFDGSGFPDRLAGAAIPLPARILAACAAYDWLERARQLKPLDAFEPSNALEGAAGTQFDPAVITALLASVPAPA